MRNNDVAAPRDLPFMRNFALSVALALVLCPPAATAQGPPIQPEDHTRPLVVLDTGGHHAPVRSILFTPAPDRLQLLTGGQDKRVHVWDLADGRLNLSQTLRPPIWRGYAGAVYAMALSPRLASEKDQRLLAVAGYGVGSRRGDILLYRFPGANGPETGDVAALLKSGTAGEARPTGHLNAVNTLAFSPDGRFLASGGHDAKVLIWDVARRAVIGELPGHRAVVNKLAYTPDGRSIVTGTGDLEGVIRVFDVATRQLRNAVGPASRNDEEAKGVAILSLAVSPGDGRYVVIGRENGQLLRFDAATLANPTYLPVEGILRPVESLALSRDGTQLATSIVSQTLASLGSRPPVECHIELRRMPDGVVTRRIATTANLAYAVAFSPDDSILAFSGGNLQPSVDGTIHDTQGVTLIDLRRPGRPTVEVRGQGSSLLDVGFARDSRTIGFTRQRAVQGGAAPAYEGFDLAGRRTAPVDPTGLQKALRTWNGWSIRARNDVYTLDVLNPRGQGWPVVLDRVRDRRWWSLTFIPPGPGHPRPTVAIGCEGGVIIISLDTGKRTRYLAGHGGPVTAMAVSPDGRWLVTTSTDQTAALWPLAGCDVLAPLGAEFGRRGDGTWQVTKVEPQGFADRAGLKAGDVIESSGFDRELPPAEFVTMVGQRPPDSPIQMVVRRGNQRLMAGTTKRSYPALSLFLGEDGEWVVWMPEGYYETSPAGDKQFLGWHRNPPYTVPPPPTDHFPAEKFAAELRKPAVLDALFRTADVGQALAAAAAPAPPEQVVVAAGPPLLRVAEPAGRPAEGPLVVQAPELSVRALVSSVGRGALKSLRLQLEGQTLGQPITFDPPREAEVDQELKATLPPGRYRLNVVAANAQGKERIVGFDVEHAAAPPRPPRLVVLGIGVARFGDPKRTIRFADEDVKDTQAFLIKWGRDGFGQVDEPEPLLNAAATSQAIASAFETLEQQGLGPGDTAVVVLESHLLTHDGQPWLLGGDAGPGLPPKNAVPAKTIVESLGRLAASGGRVIVLIDGVHASAPAEWQGRMGELVRALSKQNVITFVGSNQGPSQRLLAHGAFFQGVLDSTSVRGQARRWVDPKDRFTLDDFAVTVTHRVRELTQRKQTAFCYVPETLSRHAPFLDARPAKLALGR